VRARPAHQLRRGEAENVATRLLDVNDLSAELCELGANVGLGDQLPGADRTNALQRTERGRDARRFRSLKLLDPLRDGASKLFNLVLVLHESWIVRHATPPVVGTMQSKIPFQIKIIHERHAMSALGHSRRYGHVRTLVR